MKAILCQEYGVPEKLVLSDLPRPKAGAGQIVIEVKACALNFGDTLLIANRYQLKLPIPFVPGAEVAGFVKEIGDGVTDFKIGDRVLAFLKSSGGLQEEVIANPELSYSIPDSIDFHTAAGLFINYSTAYYALKECAHLQPKENLVVLGAAGGIGLAFIEIGKAIGARVIAAASSPEKIELAKQHGADEGFVYPPTLKSTLQRKAFTDQIKALTYQLGADVLCDPVGGNYSEAAVKAMNWNGRFLVIGFAAGEIPSIPLNHILLNNSTIMGVFWLAFSQRNPIRDRHNFLEILRWAEQGKLKPQISAIFPLERASEALRLIADRKAQGKVIVAIEP